MAGYWCCEAKGRHRVVAGLMWLHHQWGGGTSVVPQWQGAPSVRVLEAYEEVVSKSSQHTMPRREATTAMHIELDIGPHGENLLARLPHHMLTLMVQQPPSLLYFLTALHMLSSSVAWLGLSF
jgi:hypothetical protein